jgi:hypothetical protein
MSGSACTAACGHCGRCTSYWEGPGQCETPECGRNVAGPGEVFCDACKRREAVLATWRAARQRHDREQPRKRA